MSYIIEQKIKGTTYVYDVKSYWDKEKKQARQKRVCLGKKDEVTGKLIPSKTQMRPESCRDYGNYHFLDYISEKTGLKGILKARFPEQWEDILTCAYYEISERKPLYLCEQWSEATQTSSGKVLSSQRISELLKTLGESNDERLNFFKDWGKYRAEREYLAFDITSISSYSKMLEMLEPGYNRDGEDLPQINMGMLFGETSMLPIFYNLYQGSIKDVKTLSNMIKYAEHLNLSKVRFVMDKGFYSDKNVNEMLEKSVKFTIAVPFTAGYAKDLVDSVRESISSPANSFMINGDLIHFGSKVMSKNGKRLYAFVFYNERHYIDAKETLLKNIILFEDKLKNKDENPYDESQYSKYLIVRNSKKGIIVHREEEKIYEALKYKGYLVIISNEKNEPHEVLRIYRAKDSVEKAFDNLKNELDSKRLRVHSDEAMKGRLFVAFISLILHSWIDCRMKEESLYKNYTQEGVMYELKKLKIVELTTRKKMLTEISKNQQDLFKAFKVPPPVVT